MRSRGQLVVAVLGEAVKHFGTITPNNRAQVAIWVQRRVQQLTGEPEEPVLFDVKTAAAGRDE